MSCESRASQLVGSTPTGAVRRLSLATRRCLQQIMNEGVPTAVVVGVSGGPDSLALLVVATDLCRRWNIPVAGVYVDHRIRPESSNEARHVYDVVQSVGAHPAIMDADMEAYREGGPEARARSARRDALVRYATQWARESGTTAATILLGHTMDDQAETVMLRLARGSGAHSLSAMRRRDLMECGGVAITWLRPLLDQRRADTHQVCRDLKLAWVDDPTNAVDGPWRASDGSALRRAAVRQWALPARNVRWELIRFRRLREAPTCSEKMTPISAHRPATCSMRVCAKARELETDARRKLRASGVQNAGR